MDSLKEYRGISIQEHIRQSVPEERGSGRLLFVMGPYRLLDPAYLYPNSHDFELPPDPLAPRASQNGVNPDEIEATLRGICEKLSKRVEVTAFLASEVDIPTKREVEETELTQPGMSVIEQSLAFAKASDGNAFIFTKASLTTGVGCESGALPEYFALRSPEEQRRPSETFCIFEDADYDPETGTYEPKFGSASIDEMDKTYDIPFRYFGDRADLVDGLTAFAESYVIPSTL